MKICDAIELLSIQTWSTLATCHAQGIAINEDVVTTNNLVFLSNNVPGTFVAFDTRPWEYFVGCDFEMWIGSNQTGWCGYAIQAKRIQVITGKYTQLAHTNALGRQIDLLDNYATWSGTQPLYLFYNTLSPYIGSLCSSAYPPGMIGCTITPSHVVDTALSTYGAKNFGWIHARPETALWRCLTCCQPHPGNTCFAAPSGAHPLKQLPARVQQVMRSGLPPTEEFDRYERTLRPKAIVVIDTSADVS